METHSWSLEEGSPGPLLSVGKQETHTLWVPWNQELSPWVKSRKAALSIRLFAPGGEEPFVPQTYFAHYSLSCVGTGLPPLHVLNKYL